MATKRHAQITPGHIAQMSTSTLREQARLAENYASERPANDLDGYLAALRDAEAMRAEIAARATA